MDLKSGAIVRLEEGEHVPKGYTSLGLRMGEGVMVERLQRLPGGSHRKQIVGVFRLVDVIEGTPGRIVLELVVDRIPTGGGR